MVWEASRADPLPEPNASLVYDRRGSGPPLVLLHGIGHHWQAWEPVMNRLAEERDVIALDFPGFGRSPAIPTGTVPNMDRLIDALAEFFASVGVERPHVAGNSMGGIVALELAQRGLVRSATAFSPAGFWTPAERSYTFAVLSTLRFAAGVIPLPLARRLASSRAGRVFMLGAFYAKPSQRLPEAAFAEFEALRNATGFDLVRKAGANVRFEGDIPDVPVTIAWGTRDYILRPRQGLRARQTIPGARLIRLPGCGHIPMSDDPELVARVILQGSAEEA